MAPLRLSNNTSCISNAVAPNGVVATDAHKRVVGGDGVSSWVVNVDWRILPSLVLMFWARLPGSSPEPPPHGDGINRGELQPAGVVVGIRLVRHQDLFTRCGRSRRCWRCSARYGVARVVGVVHKEHAVVGKVWVEGQPKQPPSPVNEPTLESMFRTFPRRFVERVHDLDDATLFVDIQPVDGSWGRFGSNGVIQAVGHANRFKFLGRKYKAGAGGHNEREQAG